uniref:Wsv011-like protein n=1 Tax=Penaeus monodon endogenous nimavirus TaxID=2133795 RepID=A0A401IPL0_9VIRU|nr:MAG: wsv011-like protein [Penaeus monodon endogenous nimavirus]GBG35558.1 wsv011-like protein [Penaeus monodon endogenous nimavirus]
MGFYHPLLVSGTVDCRWSNDRQGLSLTMMTVTGTLRRIGAALKVAIEPDESWKLGKGKAYRESFHTRVMHAKTDVQHILEKVRESSTTLPYNVSPNDIDLVHNLATIVYDPDILRHLMSVETGEKSNDSGDGLLLSILIDPACQFAANATALLASVEEKLDIVAGTNGLLKRTIDAVESSPAPLDSLLSNPRLSAKLRKRLHQARLVGSSPANHELFSEIMRRASHIKRSPAPHHPELLSIFGGCIGTGMPITGSVAATTHHERYLTHIMKVALKDYSPAVTTTAIFDENVILSEDISQAHLSTAIKSAFERALGSSDLVSSSPISAIRLCRNKGSTLAIQNVSELLYGDHQALFAYKHIHCRAPNLVKTSIVPSSYHISDTPSELVLLKASDSNNNELELDARVFITRLAFGAGWDDHMSEYRADMLLSAPVHGIYQESYTDPEYLLTNINSGPGGGGSAQMALAFISAFVRTAAGSIQSNSDEKASEQLDPDSDPMHRHTVAQRVWTKIQRVASHAHQYVSDTLSIENDKVKGAIVSQLLLSRVIDGAHEVRHSGIQRTNYALHLRTRKKIDHKLHHHHHHHHHHRRALSPDIVGQLRWVGYHLPEDIQKGFQLSGIGGGKDNHMMSSNAFETTDVTIVWDGQRAEPINVVYTGTRKYHHSNHVHPSHLVAHRARRHRRLSAILNSTGIGPYYVNKGESKLRPLANLSAAVVTRGFFAEARDSLEVTALRAATREASVSMRELSESLRAINATTTEAVELRRSMAEAFETADATPIGIDPATGEITITNSGRPLIEETRALASNTRSASEVMGDLGVEVSPAVDEPFAAEMAETYPDSDILQADQTIRQIAERLPQTDLETFREAELELERSSSSISADSHSVRDDNLVSALSNSKTNAQLEKTLGQKVADGILTFAGRYGVTLVVGGIVAGSVAPSVVAHMHSSRGAHINVKTNSLAGKVQSYKIINFSCRDKSIGHGSSAEHPFQEEIDHGIDVNPDTKTHHGSIVRLNGHQSRDPAYAPVCGPADTAAGECGTWATFDRGSALPVVASMADLPPGTSLSCDKGFSLPEAVADVAIDIGADVTKDVAQAALEVVDTVGTSILSKFVSSPLFFVGVPVLLGFATGLVYGSFPRGILAGVTLLLILLVVRYFLGTGPLTQARSSLPTLSVEDSKNDIALHDDDDDDVGGGQGSSNLMMKKQEKMGLLQLPTNQSLLLGNATVRDQKMLNRLLLGV